MTEDPEKDISEDEFQALVSRWADETRRLFLLLPRFLAESKDRRVELERRQQRVAELEGENDQLRQSRAALAALHAKFKQLIEGYATDNGLEGAPAQPNTEPVAAASPITEPGGRPSSIFQRAGHRS